MKTRSLKQLILSRSKAGQKQLAVLIDSDKINGTTQLSQLLEIAEKAQVDYYLLGGSLLSKNNFYQIAANIKQSTKIPLIFFPGNTWQINEHADAILFLSLVSGRNPEYLIGQQVQAAPFIRALNMETISTGYLLIEGGKSTATSYITQSQPIPYDQPEIASATALAATMLGMQNIYLEAGSGAAQTVSKAMVQAVKSTIDVPLWVGGGIINAQKAQDLWQSGADIIVLGNILEKNPQVLLQIAENRSTKNVL